MKSYVKIKEIAIYHPDHFIDNDYYINHFDQKGKDIRRLLQHLGRKRRYRINRPGENSITMAIASCKEALQKAGLTGKDIDLIIFSTQVPEQMFPMNAMFIHQAVGGKNDALAFDLNANCSGMTIAVEQASRMMQSAPDIRRALVIGSDQLSPILSPDDEIAYPLFSDLSVSVILEKTEEQTGFIDAVHYIDSTDPTNMTFPPRGFSGMLRNRNDEDFYLRTYPLDDSDMFPHVYESIRTMLKKHHLSPANVKCCFSQSNKANIEKIRREIGFTPDQMFFVGDKFGYSGTSSPFLALYEGIKAGKIRRGDYILFWTVGTGYQFITMLFRY